MRGGKRLGAGRKPGAVSEERRKLAELAGKHTTDALKTLLHIATKGQSESARVAAAVAILDRGHGKPAQAYEHGGSGGPAFIIHMDAIDAAM